ncbi:hypothetical protein BDV12DRAFT_34400 [Aspergillus spectabilis]
MRMLTTLLMIGVLSLGTAAQECRGRRSQFSSQEEIDDLIHNCTTIADEIQLVNYNGTLELPNITNITRLAAENSSITSAQFPDLEYVNDFISLRQEHLNNVSFPRLHYAHNISLRFANETSEIEFPELENLSSIELRNALSVSFPLLRIISDVFHISTGNSPGFPNNESTIPIELSFPVLESTHAFSAIGNVER